MNNTDDTETNNIKERVSIFEEHKFSIKTPGTSFFDLTTIFSNQNKILHLLEERLNRDNTKEKAFNRLYEELDAVKYNKAFQKIEPLYLDLILLYDRINLLKSENNTLDTILEELLEILSKQNVEIIDIENDIFDLSLQKAVETQIVEEEEYDSRVIRVVRDGFMCEDKILRVQEVVIGKYIKSEGVRQ